MVEPIVIEGQRAWLKQYGEGSRAVALGLLNFVARRFHLDALRPPPHRGGDAARETEARRLGELQAQGVPHVRGGTYLAIEGPQFSTLAESQLYRSWNCSVIGMTNMPEAKLAREAELCYASVGMVTDFDCWHPGHDAVTVDSVIRVLLGNAQTARTLVSGLGGTVTADACFISSNGLSVSYEPP